MTMLRLPLLVYFAVYLATPKRLMMTSDEMVFVLEMYQQIADVLRERKRAERNVLKRQLYRYAHGWVLREVHAIRELLNSEKVIGIGVLNLN